mmetsp:Transcript_22294/g.52528  ORF Transcript_22294/g.52528 Transcript_22294/m.52528 type:complete len:81 (+) Transcript_22294:214-456(+)
MPSDVEEAVIRRRLPARYKQEHFERVSINGFWILSALKDEYRGVFTVCPDLCVLIGGEQPWLCYCLPAGPKRTTRGLGSN